ncbi:MAG: hypothetical protein ACLFR7_05535, partial [Opitutales bacterium]
MKKQNPIQLKQLVAMGLLTGGLGFYAHQAAALDSWEYEAEEGWHREEWWDPTDWFDDEYAAYDYDYDSEAYDGYWNNDFWYDDYDYNYTYGRDYGDHYEWDAAEDEWETDYGYHDAQYDYDPEAYAIGTTTLYTDDYQQRNMDRGMERKTFNGTIEGFRHMSLTNANGQRQNYAVAKIRLQDGSTSVVNLGERDLLTDLDLQQGDDVKIRGSVGRIDNQPVVIADKIRVNNRTLDVNRAMTMQRQRAAQDAQRQQQGQRMGQQDTRNQRERQEMQRDQRNQRQRF